jgi:hypothetical protein
MKPKKVSFLLILNRSFNFKKQKTVQRKANIISLFFQVEEILEVLKCRHKIASF